jgi:hypothetical protein
MEPEDRDSASIWDMLDAASAILDFIEAADFDAYLVDRKSAHLAARDGAPPPPRLPGGGDRLPLSAPRGGGGDGPQPGVGGGRCGVYKPEG